MGYGGVEIYGVVFVQMAVSLNHKHERDNVLTCNMRSEGVWRVLVHDVSILGG